MIGIRADANKTVATGHIMRCLTIAAELNKIGEDVCFFTADHNADELLKSACKTAFTDNSTALTHLSLDSFATGSIKHAVLDSNWSDLESELPILIENLQSREIDILLVDSYYATYDYLKAIRRVCKVVYIDDLHESIFPVDMLINYNGYHKLWNYKSEYKNNTKLLLGLDFVPLRPQFAMERVGVLNNKSKAENRVTKQTSFVDITNCTGFNILLAAGGGDILHVMSTLLLQAENLKIFKDCNWNVVMGSFTDNREELMDLANKHSNIILHEKVSNMAALMKKCDISITAAGTMLTECAAMCLPAIYYLSADNQKYESDFWSQNNQMLFAGDMQFDAANTLENILEKTELLFNDNSLRLSIAKSLLSLVDGKGASRIADEIQKL